jgi:rod shape-determining protein MreC
VAIHDIRRRSGYLFVAVLLAQVVLISAQVSSRSGVPVLESVVFGIFAEVQRSVSAVVSGVRRAWGGYVGLRRVHAENEILRQQLAAARLLGEERRALAERSRGLLQLLELRDRSDLSTTAAEIIAAGATPDSRIVTIDKGTRDGLRSDMAVLAPAGVVGRVVVPSARAAMVQLLIERNAAAGALIERSRAQGIVVGGGDDRLRMEYVSEVSDVVAGDIVVTSGIDGIYPKGFVIGRVDAVEKSGGSYKRITLRPAVDFSSLEDVLVVLTPAPGRAAANGGVR